MGWTRQQAQAKHLKRVRNKRKGHGKPAPKQKPRSKNEDYDLFNG